MDGFEVRPVAEGQWTVHTPAGAQHRVLIPAGVGVPGAEDGDVAAALVVELLARGSVLPEVLDASQALVREPGLLAAVTARIEGG